MSNLFENLIIFLLIVLLFLLVVCLVKSAKADDLSMKAPIIMDSKVFISWDKNKETDLSEYKINAYTVNLITTQVDTFYFMDISSLLQEPTRCYFYVTALDQAGNESEPSDTVSFVYSNKRMLFGDCNGDSTVNGSDMMMFWLSFWTHKGINLDYNPVFDFNQDGFISGIDHQAMVENFYWTLPKE